MKTFLKTIFITMLLFCTAQASYGFSGDDDSTITVPADKHRAQLTNNNDQALVIEHIVLGIPEIASRTQEECLTEHFTSPGLTLEVANTASENDVDRDYLNYAITICPALSGLVMIFPFHLFP
ncbi:hypothetical protein [Leeuwenhoekiella sp. W20_SRS_FM14]|uniref:hypothetical protein n=1 Tax=Leeuwenhoekiella sp. W20_SRS_FM14 TaxID=3240270 RepID=UPI003F993C43